MRRDHVLLAVRLLSGGVFVAFGLGKFVNHSSELASFKGYGLPVPQLFVLAIGVVELVAGALLIAGLLVRPAALVLAGDLVGAILISGIAKGELISLTLAPAELVAMLLLLRTGSGSHTVSHHTRGRHPADRGGVPVLQTHGRADGRGPARGRR